MSNTRIWDALSKTDPRHTKPFKRAGGFGGTAIKPIWLTMRLTQQFGPAGTGWGMGEPKFEVVPAGDEILVFCTVSLWYENAAQVVYGVGGDKVLGKNKYGPFTNDEAFKASYTDALSNAMKQIGMGADIHMGLFEDEKYVRETTREFANGNAPAVTEAGPPTNGWAGSKGEVDPLDHELTERAPRFTAGQVTRIKKWLEGAHGTLRLTGQTPQSLGTFRKENASKFEWVEENMPEESAALEKAYTAALDAAQARMPVSNTLLAG